MYEGLKTTYALTCPLKGQVSVALSAFRTLERLPGPAAPAVYAVLLSCRCGDEHQVLVTHEDLDWRPLVGADDSFLNLMTGKHEPLADELLEQAALHIKRRAWPWTLFCFPEERPRPVYPSAFRLVSPSEAGVLVGRDARRAREPRSTSVAASMWTCPSSTMLWSASSSVASTEASPSSSTSLTSWQRVALAVRRRLAA